MRHLIFVVCLCPFASFAQGPRDVRAVAKDGQGAIPKVAEYLNSRSVDTRVEVVKQLIALGGKDILDPLILATRDTDPEVQIRATDALVNYYVPGYVKQGVGSSLVRAGNSIRTRFSDSNDLTIDPFVIVRPDVIAALATLTRAGSSLDARANACRGVGILRGRAALPDLIEALRSKDNNIMYESLVAIRKIGDPAAGPQVVYLVRDLNERIQDTAIETAGLLRTKEALPSLRAIVRSPRSGKAERSALYAIAMMPEPVDRDLFQRELSAKDEKLRAGAAEGLGRLGNPSDVPALEMVWHDEDRIAPRLASAFALVMEGKLELSRESPLQLLIYTLNSAAYGETAYAYLVEAARREPVLTALYGSMADGTRDEKIYLARIFSASGNRDSIPILDKASRDTDAEVAKEGLRALRSLRARLGV